MSDLIFEFIFEFIIKIMLTKLFGEISRLRAASPFHSVRLSPRSARNDGRGCEIRELAEIFVSEILAKGKTAFLRQRPQFANTFAFAGKVNAARIVWCALKGRAAEENSDCTEQSEDNGVFLKITKICFNSLKQIL